MISLPLLDNALCRQTDPELFFPHRSDSLKYKKAKKICERCLDRIECQTYAVQTVDVNYGVWGGINMRELKGRGLRYGKDD